MSPSIHARTSALIVGVAIVLAAYFLADAARDVKFGDRHVTVKGLAERTVTADWVVWPLSFSVSHNDLQGLQSALEQNTETVIAYLMLNGFDEAEINRAAPRIVDLHAQSWGNDQPRTRFNATVTITVQSPKVDAAKAAMASAGDLIGEGVILAETYGPSAQFLFNGLNDIKPDMIASATKNARAAAEQFARDSNSQVGGIRRAKQGVFTISERDINSPETKIVRVVSTIDFYLVD
ncbi:MAG: SIMPL domain-containing protein [Xanthomonadales bacterium]|nr:SIMPL domain-containing protein [Xanthomonadales bacterium]